VLKLWRRFTRKRKARQRLKDALGLLRRFDKMMKRKGMNRTQRRYFWREFVNTDQNRQKLITKIEKVLKIDTEKDVELFETEKEKESDNVRS